MGECLRQCGAWAVENNYKPEFSFVSDRDDEFWTQIKSSYDSLVKDEEVRKIWGLKVGGLIEGNKAVDTPIQAADLIAWEFTKYIKQAFGRSVEHGYKIKPSFNALNADGSKFVCYSYEELLADLLDAITERLRQRMEAKNSPELELFANSKSFAQLQNMVHESIREAKEK